MELISIEQLSDLLKNSLKVLIIDDERPVLNLLAGIIEYNPLFMVERANSIEECEKIAKNEYWHCWLIDLYVPEIANGLYIIKKYGDMVPIIALSGRASASIGFQCGKSGIIGFFDKSEVEIESLRRVVFTACLRKLLQPDYPSFQDTNLFERATDTLFSHPIDTVGHWASLLGVTRRSLENACINHTDLSPKSILSLYKLYWMVYRACNLPPGKKIQLSQKERSLLTFYATFASRLRTMILNRGK